MVKPPAWIPEFANRIALKMQPIDVMAPLGCHYHLHEGVWEITLFPSQTEVIGGVHDGKKRTSPFSLDLQCASSLFDRVDNIAWQSMPADEDDEIGSHASISGVVNDHKVILTVCAVAPERFHPGRYANVYEERWVETW